MDIVFIAIIIGIIIVITFLTLVGSKEIKEDSVPHVDSRIKFIDCEHNVICYRNGHHVSAFSCTSVEKIEECNIT